MDERIDKKRQTKLSKKAQAYITGMQSGEGGFSENDAWRGGEDVASEPPVISGLARIFSLTAEELILYRREMPDGDVIIPARTRLEQLFEEKLFLKDSSQAAKFLLKYIYDIRKKYLKSDCEDADGSFSDKLKGMSDIELMSLLRDNKGEIAAAGGEEDD